MIIFVILGFAVLQPWLFQGGWSREDTGLHNQTIYPRARRLPMTSAWIQTADAGKGSATICRYRLTVDGLET